MRENIIRRRNVEKQSGWREGGRVGGETGEVQGRKLRIRWSSNTSLNITLVSLTPPLLTNTQPHQHDVQKTTFCSTQAVKLGRFYVVCPFYICPPPPLLVIPVIPHPASAQADTYRARKVSLSPTPPPTLEPVHTCLTRYTASNKT